MSGLAAQSAAFKKERRHAFDSGPGANDTAISDADAGSADRQQAIPSVTPMPQPLPFPIRKECPPGACVCDRDRLLADPHGDLRILRLTRDEEKKLIARIETISSYAALQNIADRMQAQLGIALRITPSSREVRTVRGISIQLAEHPGLCRKTRLAIPAAIRRCLDRNPEIVYALLDAHGLLGGG